MSPVYPNVFPDDAATDTAPEAELRDQVRLLLQDGTTELGQSFNVARLEDLSDQIPVTATPAQTVFTVRFSSVPVEEYVTVFAMPGTLLVYIDGAPGAAPAVDVDQNGTFSVSVPPLQSLQVSYAWGFFSSANIDGFMDQARAWLQQAGIDTLVDGLRPALIEYAASLAAEALARKCAMADATAGDAGLKLSQIAQRYQALGEKWMTEAIAARDSFYSGAGARQSATGLIGALTGAGVPNWQPPR